MNRANSSEQEKKLAAVCGLYCRGCTLFIATMEDPERLRILAGRYGLPEEAVRCFGCRSDKRGPYCQTCQMFQCAEERGVEFCVECGEYPCHILKAFQAEKPHRIELWENLEKIRAMGWEKWMEEMKGKYACPSCGSINSAYDMKCRKCGEEPSCRYVARHGEAIEAYTRHMK